LERLIVVDGKEGRIYDQVGAPVFNPNSQRVAYTAQRRGKWVVVVDGHEGPDWPGGGRSAKRTPKTTRHFSVPSALHWSVERHESVYGALETDVQKRMQQLGS
jgi:hypothetical protein